MASRGEIARVDTDVAIAFGNGRGIVMRHGEVVAKLDESKLVERFLQEVEDEVRAREGA